MTNQAEIKKRAGPTGRFAAVGTRLFNQLLPRRIDNTYLGHRLGLWIFAFVVSVKILQSLLVIFHGYETAKSADGIPLDRYVPAASQTIVALFALSGETRLFTLLLCVLVVMRYRGAISLMFVLLTMNYLAGQLILQLLPIVRTGVPPGSVVNVALFALMIVGLALSLRKGLSNYA
jgi:hypothetical protein